MAASFKKLYFFFKTLITLWHSKWFLSLQYFKLKKEPCFQFMLKYDIGTYSLQGVSIV